MRPQAATRTAGRAGQAGQAGCLLTIYMASVCVYGRGCVCVCACVRAANLAA